LPGARPDGIDDPCFGREGASLAPSRRKLPMTTASVHQRFALSAPFAPFALGAALAVAVVVRGGFTGTGKAAFALAAGGALLAALATGHVSRSVARHPAVVGLALLAMLSVTSVAWTVGAPDDAIGSGLAIAGLSAMALAAASLAGRRGGPHILASAIVAAAVVTGVLGYLAAALRSEPLAQCLSGVWRPGGTFEYPPALGLAQVAALPILLRGAAARSRRTSAAAYAGAALAVGVLVLAGSRTQLALGVAVVAAALAWPRRTVGIDRSRVAAGVGVVAAGGVAIAALSRTDLISAPVRVALACAAIGLAAYAGFRRARPTDRRAAAAVLICLAAGGGMLAVGSTSPAECGAPPDGGLTHGRLALWSDSASTVAERPLAGAGAGAFLAASGERQGDSPVRFAHNLPLEVGVELGVLGLGALALLVGGVGRALWRSRGTPSLWLFGPAAVAFLVSNLVDWSWQITGLGALFAVALGGLIAAGAQR
jgi:O-Antigen ligase